MEEVISKLRPAGGVEVSPLSSPTHEDVAGEGRVPGGRSTMQRPSREPSTGRSLREQQKETVKVFVSQAQAPGVLPGQCGCCRW